MLNIFLYSHYFKRINSKLSGVHTLVNDTRMYSLVFIVLSCLVLVPEAYSAERLPDADIARAVEVNLIVDESVPAHLINVAIDNGVVTLSGSVDNLYAKKQALQQTERVKGVTAVIDLIQINPVPREDKEIREDVELALLEDPATDAYELSASVEEGVVRLSGTVESWVEKNLAGEVAAQVKGVKGVNIEDIRVDIQVERPDAEIRQDIVKTLELDEYIDDARIDVTVNNGKVTLTGTAASLAEKNRARIAAYVAGVRSVNAEDLAVRYWLRDEILRKRPNQVKGDLEIQKAIERALKNDPRVLSFNISTDVSLGMATLSGVVDNLGAKRAAEEDARNTTGVWSVKNLIKVRPVISTLKPDTDLALDVMAAFERDYLLDPGDISIAVVNRKVFLNGSVDYRYESIHAEEVVSRVPGVVDVQNNLEVDSSWKWKSDIAIQLDIRDEFLWSVFVDGEDLDIAVSDGVATISGRVADWGEFKAAVNNSFEGGAKRVKTRLYVEDLEKDIFQTYFYPFESVL